MVNIVIITQARVGSNRFPSKILKKINKDSLLEIHLSRLIKSKRANGVVVATTFEKDTDKIEMITKKLAINFFQGDTEDVLDRYYNAAIKYSADYIVRVTSDCPLIDPNLIDKLIGINKKFKITASVGPCIQQKSYEVDHSFFKNFVNDDKENELLFKKKNSEKFLFDLRGYVNKKLKNNGIIDVDNIEMDTFSDDKNFFSYRRSLKLAETDYGRCISTIKLL